MNLDELYQTIILDHYKEKHHSGMRDPFTAEVHHVNPSCGDELTLRANVKDGIVTDVSYVGDGCSISQASTSIMTDLVIGMKIEQVLELEREFVVMMESQGQYEPDEDRFEDAIAFAGVSKFPARVKCALLGWAAVKDAIARSVCADQSKENHA